MCQKCMIGTPERWQAEGSLRSSAEFGIINAGGPKAGPVEPMDNWVMKVVSSRLARAVAGGVLDE